MNLVKKLIITATLFSTSHTVVAVEQPEFEVLYQDGKIEYRLYESYVVAETTIEDTSSYGRAATKGFMRLFDYISGDNISAGSIAMTAPVQQKSAGEKIAMTTPVQQHQRDEGWSIAFMLPGKYDIGTAPKPASQQIRLREIPPRLMAVIRYSGRWTEKNFDKYTKRLISSIQEADIGILSAPESAVYNPPFTPPFMRHNEIQIEVSGYPDGLSVNTASQ